MHPASLFLRKIIFFCCFASLGLPIKAMAETQKAFDVQSFRPTPGPRDLVIVPQTEAISHLSVAVGLFFSFSLDPLVLVDASSGGKLSDIVKNRVEFDIMAAVGLTRWLEIGIILPIVAYQAGDSLRELGREGSVSPGKLGDFSVIAKVPLIHRKQPDVGFGLAAALRTNVPTGSVNDFTSDGTFTFNPTVNIDYRFKKTGILLAMATGVYFRPTVVLAEADGPRLGPMFTAQAGAEVPLKRDWGITAVGGVYVNVPLTTPIEQGCVPSEALLGLRWYSTDLRSTFTSGFNFGIGCGLSVPTFRYWLSAVFVPPKMKEQSRIDFFKTGTCPQKRLRKNDKYFFQCPLLIQNKNKLVVLPGIQFILDEPDVDPASFVLLDQVVSEIKQILRKNPSSLLLIEGHTDPRGPTGNEYNYNLELSQKRAERVLKYLVLHDIPSESLAAIGYGYLQPVPNDELPDGTMSQDDLFYINRRVDFSILTKKELQDALDNAPKQIGTRPAKQLEKDQAPSKDLKQKMPKPQLLPVLPVKEKTKN